MLTQAPKELENEKCCIFTKTGVLLWTSPGWFPDGKVLPTNARMLNRGWMDFVYTPDLEKVMRWFASDDDEMITFRCMRPDNGTYELFAHCKIPYGQNWLTVGDSWPIDPPPMLLGAAGLPNTGTNG